MERFSRTAELEGQRLLVTGASGFIGARLCQRATSLGATVHAVSRQPSDTLCDGLSDKVQWEQADLADHEATNALLRRVRPDFVAHLASEVTGDRDRSMILPTLRANLFAAVNVMLAADSVQCRRIVLAGSIEEPSLDTAGAHVQSPYVAAKWSTHAYARLFHGLYDLPVVDLRLSMVYGPGQNDLRKLVPYVTTTLLRGEAPQLTSGQRKVDWIYIDDVVDAFLTSLVAPNLEGMTLEIGCGELVSVQAVVARLRRIVGSKVEPEFGALPDRKLEGASAADPRIARDAMGWRPGRRSTMAWRGQ